MKKIAAILALALLGVPAKGFAQARSELPIREVVLSDGVRRYAVAIKIGDTALDAGLDSGSTGLRVLSRAVRDGDVKTGTEADRYSYGSGTRFEGHVGSATLTFGEASGPGPLQVIAVVGCVEKKPQCPANHVPKDRFGIQGDGLPGEGFPAILGVNMANADVPNPFSAIGIKRWIIELPRPGSREAGRLVLNPDDGEVKDFTLLPLMPDFRKMKGDLHDAVRGCIVNDGAGKKACGPLTMDTGAPGIWVTNSDLGATPWPNGTAAILTFLSGEHAVAMETFTVGQKNHASRLIFDHEDRGAAAIRAGLSPYFAFDVLYVPGQNMIGLKPRPATPAAPLGVIGGPSGP